ncbi:hypothetical protein [Algoriphagus boritolerans]|uniref:hypothetical protein n=1 Tax=Algoriphagus boritolerans TaxID=308111 RepID=UPI002FCE47F6
MEQPNRQISGVITATNNGVSIIPSFTLGRPAVFFDLSMGGERFSFDPMLRFGMDGKPWNFVLWGRYKVIKDSRFTLTIGGHPAFLFQEVDIMVDGKPHKMMVSNRYLAGEAVTNYEFSEKFSMGLYYLRGTGVQVLGARNTDFLALNSQISNLQLVKDFKLRINPQLFFLKVDENSGFYVNSALTLSKGDFPVEFQGFFNQKIRSEVAGDDLVWNMSLLYKFSNTFSKKIILMEKAESLEEFYKRKFNWIPENLKQDLGHFNLFNLEPYLEGKMKAVPYRRRDFYKVMLFKGASTVHYADRVYEVKKTGALLFQSAGAV